MNLDEAWQRRWGDGLPVGRDLKRHFPARWVRRGERHREALGELLGDDDALIAITCSWSATSDVVPRDEAVARAMPDATHWRSYDLGKEPGFNSWHHNFVSRTTLGDPALERLLQVVAEDLTDDVIIADPALSWLYHPLFTGGADLIA